MKAIPWRRLGIANRCRKGQGEKGDALLRLTFEKIDLKHIPNTILKHTR